MDVAKYKVDWDATVGSEGQRQVKNFFREIWEGDLVCEELRCRPLLRYNYRADLVNIDKMIAVEYHGHPGHIKFCPYIHKTEDDFYDSLERDRAKELFWAKNHFSYVELYPKNLPINYSWLREKYNQIYWPMM